MAENGSNACVLIIGNEILSGRTQDANLQFLGKQLNLLGISVAEARVIPDSESAIVSGIRECKSKFNYIFTTGGIGPTHDDITASAVALALNLPIERNNEAETILRNFYSNENLTEARLSMADMPVGAILLENPVSKAPGFQVANIFVLPGIPHILEAIFGCMSYKLVGGQPILSKSIVSFLPEGETGTALKTIQLAHPEAHIGSYPFFRDGKVGANIVVRSTNTDVLEDAANAVREMIKMFGIEPFEL